MPEFIARVGTTDGVVMERSFTAESEEALRTDLQGREYLVFEVRRKGGWLDLLPGFGSARAVRMKEFLLFNQELAALIRAGLPIIASLDILLERRKNPAFRKALADIRDRVRGGAALSEAFDAQGEMFPKIFSSTLASGERSGELASVLQRFAIARFLTTLGTLIAGGIPAVTALGIASRAVGNIVFERRLLEVERKVREGGSLWESLEETRLFSDIAIEMTKVGESTGSL